MQSVLRLVVCLAICLCVAALGSAITVPEIRGWYAGLTKPPGTPPNWVFGPVWTTLYTLMSVSLWLLWDRSEPSPERARALALFGSQLVLNAAWSSVFFGLHQVVPALAIITAMVVVTAGTIAASWKLNRVAAILLVPYLAWISYATWLNAGIWALNRLL